MKIYTILYNKISENHIPKKINNVVDFSFINKMLEDSYCKHYSRPDYKQIEDHQEVKEAIKNYSEIYLTR